MIYSLHIIFPERDKDPFEKESPSGPLELDKMPYMLSGFLACKNSLSFEGFVFDTSGDAYVLEHIQQGQSDTLSFTICQTNGGEKQTLNFSFRAPDADGVLTGSWEIWEKKDQAGGSFCGWARLILKSVPESESIFAPPQGPAPALYGGRRGL